MRSKAVYALECVTEDLNAAARHYQSWRRDGTAHVLSKYEETISWIEWNPELFPKKFGNIRRAILKRSHYVIYFIQEPEYTLVLGVLDGRRKPAVLKTLVTRRKLTGKQAPTQ